MTLTKMQAMLGVATIILTITSVIGGAVASLETRFGALDTRLGKLESALKVMNATTIDERYKQAIKELMAEAQQASPVEVKKADRSPRFGLAPSSDAGASASAPAASRGYERKDSTTHRFMCSHDGEAEVPCDVLYPPFGGAAADAPAVKVPQ